MQKRTKKHKRYSENFSVMHNCSPEEEERRELYSIGICQNNNWEFSKRDGWYQTTDSRSTTEPRRGLEKHT